MELRSRMQWGQTDLADQITKHSTLTRTTSTPDHCMISDWEHGRHAPSPVHRMALSKIAAKRGHEDLAMIFRASTFAWGLTIAIAALGLADDE